MQGNGEQHSGIFFAQGLARLLHPLRETNSILQVCENFRNATCTTPPIHRQIFSMSVFRLRMSQVLQRQNESFVSCDHEVPLSVSQSAENWEAGEIPALPPQR